MQTLVESFSQRWAHCPAEYGLEFLSIKAQLYEENVAQA